LAKAKAQILLKVHNLKVVAILATSRHGA